MAFNLQASLGEEGAVHLAATRDRIRKDALSLLGSGLSGSVSVNLIQAPVFHGYLLSVYTRLARAVSEEEIRAALAGGIVSAQADTQPSNQAAVESGELMISVRADAGEPGAAWLLLAADNLRLAARTAVAAAMDLAALRPSSGVQ